MAGAPRNPAPRNHFLVRIVKSYQAATAEMRLAETDIVRRVPTPLRSTSPFSEVVDYGGEALAGFVFFPEDTNLSLSIYIYIYICIYLSLYIYMCIYIYIYILRMIVSNPSPISALGVKSPLGRNAIIIEPN